MATGLAGVFGAPRTYNSGGGGYSGACATINRRQCFQTNEQVCNTVVEDQCSTHNEQQCRTVTEEKCGTKYESLNAQNCNTSYDRHCSVTFEDVCGNEADYGVYRRKRSPFKGLFKKKLKKFLKKTFNGSRKSIHLLSSLNNYFRL